MRLGPRSGPRHKAWGVSPRIMERIVFAARETGAILNGFRLSPAIAGFRSQLDLTWGLRPRLYADRPLRGLSASIFAVRPDHFDDNKPHAAGT